MTGQGASAGAILKDLSSDLLADRLRHLVPSERAERLARRVQVLAVKEGRPALPGAEPEFKRSIWQGVLAATSVPHLTLTGKITSSLDGFTKYLFRGYDGAVFESVRIPLLHRSNDKKYVVCVSSQVGCAVGCAFCATGRLGFGRHLETWEIVDQVVQVNRDSDYPVRGVVFMGMGEPLLNYDRVRRAARILSEPCGMAIDGRAITISTVGIPRQIRRFASEPCRHRLITSIHSAIPERRALLVPFNKMYPLADVFDALREYHAKSRRRIVLAWTMVRGFNMDLDEARALRRWTDGLPIILDLIPVNDATGRFLPPDRPELDAWLDLLRREVNCPVVCRYSGGWDINGACGMLAAGSEVDEGARTGLSPRGLRRNNCKPPPSAPVG